MQPDLSSYAGRGLAAFLITVVVCVGGAALAKLITLPILRWARATFTNDRVWAEHVYFTAMHARARLRTASGSLTHRDLIALCREVAALLTSIENPPP